MWIVKKSVLVVGDLFLAAVTVLNVFKKKTTINAELDMNRMLSRAFQVQH